MKIKTSALFGPALDWAAAVALGYTSVQITDYQDADTPDHPFFSPGIVDADGREICGSGMPWEPSTNWAQGGPIIDREISGISDTPGENRRYAWSKSGGPGRSGDTKLIAAMRCVVAARLGDEVEIPDVLVRNAV